MSKIRVIRSGGQTGVDRGALDAARDLGFPITGWCPAGGLAEDFPNPPGLLKEYPELKETPSREYLERTVWNVRDSDATLILKPQEVESSYGTDYTMGVAGGLERPCLVLDRVDVASAIIWLDSLEDNLDLNIAGLRESKFPGIYDMTYDLVTGVLGHYR